MKIIKKILLIIFLLFSTTVIAADVTFLWDANTEPDLAGYKIYRSNTSGDYNGITPISIPLSSLSDPLNPEYTEQNIPDGIWYWVATAYDIYDNESEYSIELTKSIDTTPPSIPQNFREKTN